MTELTTAANADLAIGTQAAIDTSSDSAAITDFQNDTYQPVGEIETIPSFGDSINSVNFTAVGDARVRKFKGSRDAGSIELTLGFKVDDPGQVDLKAALDDESQDDFNFRATINDKTSGGSNTVFYFSGKVMSRNVEPSSVDNIVKATVNIAINSAIYQVDGS